MPTGGIRTRTSGIMIPAFVTPAAGYQGPGNFATFASWYGLRAYSSAQLSGSIPAIDIVKASDGSNLVTVNIKTNGSLDTAAVTGHPDFPAIRVSKLYDQVGSNHLVQSALGSDPQITIGAAGLGAGLPSLAFVGAGTPFFLQVAVPANVAQPFCMSAVTIRRGDFTTSQIVFIVAQDDFVPQMGFDGSANNVAINAGTNLTAAATDGTWLAYQALFNGASSTIRINGTNTNGAAGADTIATGQFYEIGSVSTFTAATLNGDICEVGVAASDISGSFASIDTNQRAYWGF